MREGSEDLGGNHMVFFGGGRMGDQSSPTGVSANSSKGGL